MSKKEKRSVIGEAIGANRRRGLPSVDRVLAHEALTGARESLPHDLVTRAVRETLSDIRESLHRNGNEAPDIAQIALAASEKAWEQTTLSLKPVVNATGVIIHTNLGRAPLSRAALEAAQRVAGYGNLEFDLEAGARGSRYVHAVEILRRVTGCESALVVNNNAAALVLVLAALAREREVVVSRGQLVEIGGGFRVPEIMRQSGAKLMEVGTTNRTYLSDYSEAISDNTALLMRIHASNFRIVGFTTTPDIAEVAELAHQRGLFAVDDVGSGALIDTTRYGLSAEPLVQESLRAGADLVLFSGDKLLGGPQCGVIVGKWALVETLKKHPLARALRVDKLTLAALEATLVHYLKGEAEKEIPVWRMISASADQLRGRVEGWSRRLAEQGIDSAVIPGQSAIGGGSLPAETLPTWLLKLMPIGREAPTAEDAGGLAHALRTASTPIIARVEQGGLLIDPRTVLEGEEEALLAGLVRALKRET